MRRALELATGGKGYVSPNPMVGAVIVKNDRIIGEGFHQKYGGDHAEIAAIKSAEDTLRDATLYCSLEPCCHTKKQTPPCAQRIIKKGIRRVVVASKDTNPQVSGKGITLLRSAGIEVDVGPMHQENLELNKFYFHRIKTGKPYITLKIAQSVDGRISTEAGTQTWLTGEPAVTKVHQWRSEYDAILVGANTINIDDPLLNVRNIKGRDPKIVILTGRLNLNPDKKVFKSAKKRGIIVFTNRYADDHKIKQLAQAGITVHKIKESGKDMISIEHILDKLVKSNIISVLVEGGSQVFSQFIEDDLFDELQVFTAPKILGSGLKGFDVSIERGRQLRFISQEIVGNDVLCSYRK